MVGDLCYAVVQTSALMVTVVDRVRLAGARQGKLKVLQGALVGMKEKVRNSKVERQVIVEQIDTLAYEKAALEEQVATLEDQSERLEDQVSSLT